MFPVLADAGMQGLGGLQGACARPLVHELHGVRVINSQMPPGRTMDSLFVLSSCLAFSELWPPRVL